MKMAFDIAESLDEAILHPHDERTSSDSTSQVTSTSSGALTRARSCAANGRAKHLRCRWDCAYKHSRARPIVCQCGTSHALVVTRGRMAHSFVNQQEINRALHNCIGVAGSLGSRLGDVIHGGWLAAHPARGCRNHRAVPAHHRSTRRLTIAGRVLSIRSPHLAPTRSTLSRESIPRAVAR